jgi:hypothetical protein
MEQACRSVIRLPVDERHPACRSAACKEHNEQKAAGFPHVVKVNGNCGDTTRRYLAFPSRMHFVRHTLTVLSLCSILSAQAQVGGKAVFRVLDIPSSARIAALGGSPVAVLDNDLNLGLFNPALLNKDMQRQVALSYLPYVDKINIGYGSYCHHFDSLGITASGSVQYVDYGTFTRTDETGQEQGTFRAGEYVVQVGGGRAIDSLFRVGVNLKYIASNLEEYRANAVAFDVAGVYFKQSLGLTVAATLRNIGTMTKTFAGTKEELPFQVQLATTYKFKHAPFRLGLSLDNLQQWDLTYDDPTAQAQIDPTTGEIVVDKVTTVEKALWHIVPNAEVLFGKNFMIRLGYNYKRRQELNFAEKPGLTGMSVGIGLKVSKMHLSYGFAQFFPGSASNTFSLAIRFADFKKAQPAG